MNEIELPEFAVNTAIDEARAIVVVSKDDYAFADAKCSGLLILKKKIEDDFSESKAKTYSAWKSVVAQERGHLDGIDEARRIIKGKMISWADEQEKKRREEEERQRAEDKKIAEEEALAKAQALEKQGNHEAAAAVIEEAAQAPAPRPQVESYVPKSSSVFSTRWSATITDPLFVLKAIEAAGKVLSKSKAKDVMEAAEILRQAYNDAKYMVYDQVALNRQATATKEALKLGGVTFSSRKV